MPCLDTDLYRNTHAHTRNRGIHALLHTCMHRYAHSSLCLHTRNLPHTGTHTHAWTYTRVPTHTHAHYMLSQHREAGLYIYEREMLLMIPSKKYSFTWSKHKKSEVAESRAVIVFQLWPDVPLSRSGLARQASKFGTMSSLAPFLFTSTVHWDLQHPRWLLRADHFLYKSDEEKPLKVDIVKCISFSKGKDNP